MTSNQPRTPLAAFARRAGRTIIAVTLGVTAFAALAVAGLSASSAAASAGTVPTATGPRVEATNGRQVVAIVLGRSGSDTADVLAPYEVFASSPAFAVYTVSDSTAPASLDGGLAVVPSYSFADVAAGTAPAADLIVVPAVNDPGGSDEQAARTFVSSQYDAGVRILGVCAGSRLLAASGILDGLRATSHWSRIGALEASNADVTWVRGQRYVQDGRVTTTGGVTSSIWGSLKVMADLAGPDEASRVGSLIDHPGWSPDAPVAIPAQAFSAGDLSVLANTAFPWGRPVIDVQLDDGVDEIDAAALLEVYNYSQAAAANASSTTGTITTRHGLLIHTDSVGTPDHELVVAGVAASRSGRHGFDAGFEHLSRHASPTVVTSIAKMLEYPLDRVEHGSAPPHLQWRAGFLTTLGVLLAIGIGAMPRILTRARRRS